MKRLQAHGRRPRSASDPDVTGVVSVIGVGAAQCDAQCRPARHHAAPRDERKTPVTTVIDRLQQAVAAIPGVTRLLPAGAGHPDQRRGSSRAQYQYTLTGTDADGGRRLGGTGWPQQLRRDPALRDVASEAQDGGLRACSSRSTARRAGRLGVSMQAVNDTLNDAFGQRQISTIYGQANQYRVILEAKPRVPERSERRCRSSTCRRPAAQPRRASTPQVPLSAARLR